MKPSPAPCRWLFPLLCLGGLLGAEAALADIAVIVHRDNPLQSMNPRDISDLYLGRSRTFKDAEQKPLQAAMAYEHPADSPLREAFFRNLNGMDLKQINAYWARLRYSGEVLPPPSLADSRAVVDAVSRNRSAIGYIDTATLSDSVKIVLRLKN